MYICIYACIIYYKYVLCIIHNICMYVPVYIHVCSAIIYIYIHIICCTPETDTI